jgi:hypothetical protein
MQARRLILREVRNCQRLSDSLIEEDGLTSDIASAIVIRIERYQLMSLF